MKSFFKILSAALLLCAFAASCGGDSTEPNPEPTPNPPSPVEDDKIVIPEGTNLSPTISQDGGRQTVRFSTKQPWQARVDDTRAAADWLHVSPASGGAGEAEMTITADPNDATDDREGYVKIVSGSTIVTITVIQKQRDALTVSPSKRTIGANETEFEVEVRANIDFQVEVQADWIEQISTRALTTTVLHFRAKRNIGDERTGAIVIRSGEKSETITVTQEKGEFIVDTEQFHIDAAAQSVSAKVRANIDFEVKSQASWIHYNPTRALTSYTLAFDIDENTTGKERTGEITVSSGEKSETITIIQSDVVFDVEFDQTEVSHEGGTITATVNSNLEYAVVLPGDVDWLTSTDTRAVTTQKHSFKIEANPNMEPRSAIIKFVYQSEKGEAEKQVIITQKSTDIRAGRTLYELGASGEQLEICVEGNTFSSYDIKYQITQGAEWISCVETRTVTAYFTFNIDKNTTGKPREGEIVFTLPDQTSTKVRIVQSATDNTVKIPDKIFKAYMVANFDNNKDGEISEYEASLITEIHCSNKYIQSLEGIEYCTALTYLNCCFNQLTSLDVSKNTALTYLNCGYNRLTTLDVSKNTALTYLSCCSNNNQLTSLDVSGCSALIELDCHSNQLTTLDVSGCLALTRLSCEYNRLTSLDINGCSALTELDCSSNQLTTLNVSGCLALTRLDCTYNQLTSLDVSKNTALTDLSCPSNRLTTLDVSKNTALTDLWCYSNQLTTLDVSKNTAFTHLDCSHNQLTTLDVSKNTALTYLNCGYNQLTTLDISGCSALTELGCESNPIEMLKLGDANLSLDFKYGKLGSSTKLKVIGTKITKLDVSENKLQSLDVSECPALTELNCRSNQLTTLDASKNTTLTELDCSSNRLTTLDVSKNTALTSLDCRSNQLTTLDVGKNTTLTELDCYDNQLSTLDVSKNTALTSLDCGNNQLPTLDVSKNTALTSLDCYYNQLTGLDVSKNTALTQLDCSRNQLTILDVSKCSALTSLDCYSNPIEVLNLGDANPSLSLGFSTKLKVIGTKITNLYVSERDLQSLDVSECPALTSLSCYRNQLTALDVSKNTALISLDCRNNQLTTLDVSKNTALTSLDCYYNQLTTLNASGCSALTSLNCYGNQLTTLNASGCSALTSLNCYGNQLTALDVSESPALTSLYCYRNQLTSLNISKTTGKNTALGTLSCYDNRLTSLDVSGCSALTSLSCGNNQLTTLDVSETNIGNLAKQYLVCAPMSTLQTLYLKTGWKIKGINVDRSTSYIPAQTEIRYKD